MLHLRIRDDNIPITRFNYLAFTEKKTMSKSKFNLLNYMIDIHQNFLKDNKDVEPMCVLDSLAVGNYNNRKQYLFLQRFSNIWERVEQREANRNIRGK